MAKHVTARLDEIDALEDQGFRYRPVRHHLGLSAFGATAWVGATAGDPIINDYDEGSEPMEELFLVVSGRATFDVDGETIDATPGTMIATQPGTPRNAVAAEAGTTVLAVDGLPGKAYDATGWELWAPVAPRYFAGEYAEVIPRLREIIATNPQYPMLSYNLACAEALDGRTAEAIEDLRVAIEGNPKHRHDARVDDDLDALRDDPAFLALLEEPAD